MTRLTKWGLVTLFWLAWSAACTTFAYSWRNAIGKPLRWEYIAPLYFAAYMFWGPLFTPFTVWMAKRFPLERNTWKGSVPRHLAALPCIWLTHALISTSLNQWIWPEMTRSEPLFHSLRRNFYMNASDDIFIYWSIVCLVHGWSFYQRYRDRELRATVLEAQLAKAQLQALKVQLHPHFLFNTLNSVSELMHYDVNAAERVVTRLSDLLRLTLENIGRQELTLREEIEFAKGYLDIEKIRFEDRLHVELDIAPETLDAYVPNLLIQPIVENSIRHGISRMSRPGFVHVRTELQGDKVVISVRDNGPGIQGNQGSPAANFGLGLTTTRSRLEMLYGTNQELSVQNLPESGVETRIIVPYRVDRAVQEISLEPLTISVEPRPMLEGVRR